MGDKPRLSIASSVGLKGPASVAHLKRILNQPTPSSLSKYSFKRSFLIDSSLCLYFSVEDIKEERIELENLLKIEDLEILRLKGFVGGIVRINPLSMIFSSVELV